MTGIPVKQLKDKDGNAIQPNSPDKSGYFTLGSGTSIPVDVETTMTADGWIFVSAYCNATAITDQPTVKVDSLSFQMLESNSTNSRNSLWIPVKKGDKVTWHIGNASVGSICKFRENRTNLENGGGEFDAISILSASESMEAIV